MESLSAYIPIDRRLVIARGQSLPDRMQGSALFADISGFTLLTDALLHDLGPRRGTDELTRCLNQVYDALIREVDAYGGSVINFSGDAITCWFDRDTPATGSGQAAWRATACGLALQRAMSQFAALATPGGRTVSLSLKVGAASGPVRRFLVGDPQIQCIDVLAGATVERMAQAEQYTRQGEVVLSPELAAQLGGQAKISEWRGKVKTNLLSISMPTRFGVVSDLAIAVETCPWPDDLDSAGVGGLSQAQIRPWLLPPVYQSIQTGRGEFLAEIRPAVALFLKFDGLDYDHDEAAGAKLDAFIRWVQNVLVRYDSYVMQVLSGDKGSHWASTRDACASALMAAPRAVPMVC
ncbi:MAG: adenylate/guanylate cyclase domain-containing protein [Chloroflexi bacterium]|nr:adenylate/guanylate cyclase domain-containing protein [Chloroflexota bacterium]